MAVKEGGGRIAIDPQEWYDLANDLRRADPKLLSVLRNRLKATGDRSLAAVKYGLKLAPPDDQPGTAGTREAIIAGLSTKASFARTTAGISISASASKMKPEHQGMLKSYNLSSFRHPVLGNRSVWVEQKGRPYFGKVIAGMVNKEMAADIQAAFEAAERVLGARNV